MFKSFAAFILSVLFTTILTSVVSTQLILTEVLSFGLEVSSEQRLDATINDIFGLGPPLLLFISVGFVITLFIVRMLKPLIQGFRTLAITIINFCSLPLILYLLKMFIGITILTSARSPSGMFAIACCCACGGWFYAFITSGESHDK